MTEVPSNRVVVIAEAGVNHNGSVDVGCRMVDVAAGAGADFVKFQTFRADRIATGHAPQAGYQTRNTGVATPQRAMLERLQLDVAAHRTLIGRCAERGIGFLSAPFDIPSIDLLVDLGLKTLKVPSGEVTNLPYLRHLGRQRTSVILSTGMATLAEVRRAIEVLEEAGTPRAWVTVLHCTTEYPAPPEEVNLRAMTTMRAALGTTTGYSDHTLGIEVPIAAVALGASVIEKHFTLDRNLPGPDHRASLEPGELKAMVDGIRKIEMAIGDGNKRPSASELRNAPIARKSIVAARAIAAGEPFTVENLAVKRPGTGISPMLWDDVLGRPAPRAFAPDEFIELV